MSRMETASELVQGAIARALRVLGPSAERAIAERLLVVDAERQRLQRRVGFVPANGGLMSTLNAWENISLPVAFHQPHKLDGALAEVHRLMAELGGVDADLLAKLPDEMTLYERRLAAYLRCLLENPDLLVVENLAAGLGPAKRRRAARFAEVYRARCPGGTFVQFEA